jgi:hypothetical protein
MARPVPVSHKVGVVTHQTPSKKIRRVLRRRLREQAEVFLSFVSGEENIHPTRAPLHDAMREIWNDHSGDPFVRQLVEC